MQSGLGQRRLDQVLPGASLGRRGAAWRARLAAAPGGTGAVLQVTDERGVFLVEDYIIHTSLFLGGASFPTDQRREEQMEPCVHTDQRSLSHSCSLVRCVLCSVIFWSHQGSINALLLSLSLHVPWKTAAVKSPRTSKLFSIIDVIFFPQQNK